MKLQSLLASAKTVAVVVPLIASVVVLSIVAYRCTNRPENGNQYAQEDLLTAMRSAKETGNCVVSCREMYGIQTKADKEWNIISNEYDENQLVLPGTKAIVIFVHGFNTGWVSGISCGNILLSKLRNSAKRTAADQGLAEQLLAHVSFFTFCWRGDLGRDRFDKAEKAADDLAPSLASFLNTIRQQCGKWAPTAKLVVITHSLGARITLEAFRELSMQSSDTLVDCLLMVQPAVAWEEVARGPYHLAVAHQTPSQYFQNNWLVQDHSLDWIFLLPRYPEGMYTYDPNTAFQILGPFRCKSSYFTSFPLAKEVVATMSNCDSVLTEVFWNYTHILHLNVRYSPDIRMALGSLTQAQFLETDSSNWGKLAYPPNLRVLYLSQGSGRVPLHAHGQIFDADGQPIVDYLYDEVLVKYFSW